LSSNLSSQKRLLQGKKKMAKLKKKKKKKKQRKDQAASRPHGQEAPSPSSSSLKHFYSAMQTANWKLFYSTVVLSTI